MQWTCTGTSCNCSMTDHGRRCNGLRAEMLCSVLVSSVWRSGERAKTKTTQLRRVVGQLESGEVLLVTMLDRLGRASRDLLNTLAAITGKEAAF